VTLLLLVCMIWLSRMAVKGCLSRLCNCSCRIWSCAAFAAVGPYGEEHLVGFITAKTVFLHECEVMVSVNSENAQLLK
jgi:hypothetical protein